MPTINATSCMPHAEISIQHDAVRAIVVATQELCIPNKDELASMCGLYQGGYQSELRRCVYHNSAGVPQWKTEINRLYYLVKEHVTVTLPQLGEEEEDYVPADAWKVSKF